MHIRHDWLTTHPTKQQRYSTLCGSKSVNADFPLQPDVDCRRCLEKLNEESYKLYHKETVDKDHLYVTRALQDRIMSTFMFIILANQWSAKLLGGGKRIDV